MKFQSNSFKSNRKSVLIIINQLIENADLASRNYNEELGLNAVLNWT